jgi:hypothetical protein
LSLLNKISVEENYKLNDYNIEINPKLREIDIERQKKHILEVTLEKENEFRSYLIDIDTWTILQSSQMKYSGWMAIENNQKFPHCTVPQPRIFDIKKGGFITR